MKNEKIAVTRVASAAIVVIIAAGAIAGVSFYYPRLHVTTTTICTSCFIRQPVVEVIIKELATNPAGGGSTNLPLNLTRGQSTTLHVEVFPESDINITFQFKILSGPSGEPPTSGLSAYFSAPKLFIRANGNGTSSLTIYSFSSAKIGVYNAAVTAIDETNTSWIWGSYFQINVS